MARIFIVDGREYPDPSPDLTVDQVREAMASFFPELATATHTERQRGEDTLYEFSRRVGTKGEFNPKCPFCGEEMLKAVVVMTDSEVPLTAEGPTYEEGIPEDSEVTSITCGACGLGVDPHHYYEHGEEGEPCDCNEDRTPDHSLFTCSGCGGTDFTPGRDIHHIECKGCGRTYAYDYERQEWSDDPQ